MGRADVWAMWGAVLARHYSTALGYWQVYGSMHLQLELQLAISPHGTMHRNMIQLLELNKKMVCWD